MNSEKAKQSKTNQGDLWRAGCSAISLIISLFLGCILLYVVASVVGSLLFIILMSPDSSITGLLVKLSITVVVSFVGVVFVGGKSIEHLTQIVVRYRGMRQERKRIERLMIQTEAEMTTETDILDDLAEAQKHKQSR